MSRLCTKRTAVSLTATLYLAGCPQLADDSFQKVDGEEVTASNGSGQTTTNALPSGATGVGLTSVGDTTGSGGSESGGTGGTETGGSDTGGNVGAGAPGTGGDDSSASSTSTSSTTGGGATKIPTTLVYATQDNAIYATAWDGAELAAPQLWDTHEHSIAFLEARMAPDGTWALVALQGEGDDGCNLHVYPHFRGTTAPAMTLSIGEPENCLSARAFDIAFEQKSGRALLVYALPGGELGYNIFEAGVPSEAQTLKLTEMEPALNWVRAVPDSASDHIVVGVSVERSTRNSLIVQEWDGFEFGAPKELVKEGTILNAESFDFAYFEEDLIALRGDATKDGFGFHLRRGDQNWTPEVFRPDALNGNAQVIELRTMPYGIAGALFDATGVVASFGTLFWQDGDFTEETRLDNELPDVSNFESASLKTDIQRLGNAAVTVYANDYAGDPGAMSSLGWAVLDPDSAWKSNEDTLPIPFDQESRDVWTRSIRLARFTAEQEGLLLAFAEDDGLFVSSLTNLEAGFTPPVLVDTNVDGLSTTPFAVLGP